MTIKKLLSLLGIFGIISFTGVTTLLLFPQPLFSNNYCYKDFNIYSNRNVDQNAINEAIDRAEKLVKESELYDTSYSYDIFLAYRSSYNKVDNKILGKWSVARAIDNNIVIKRPVLDKRQIVLNDKNQFDLAYVITHEMIHCLQENKYGKLKFNPFSLPPMWKLEGYPEYISRRPLLTHPDYNLKKGIDTFLSLSPDENQILQTTQNTSTPYIYYKGRLMTEYLIDTKGLTYDNILNDSRTEDEVYEEMLEWYRAENLINN